MNLKLQAEIIKNPSEWLWCADSDGNVIFADGVMAKRMPRPDCMLDLNKLRKGDIAQYFKDTGIWDNMEPTKLRLKEEGYTAIKLAGDMYKCWINERYFKMFKKYDFEYENGTYIRVRHPETCEIVAVIMVIAKNEKTEEKEN